MAGKILVLKGSALEQQLSDLQWKPDDDGILKEDPGQANHSADCLVYARRAVAHMLTREQPGEKRHATSGGYVDPQGLDKDEPEPRRGGSLDSLYEDGDISNK